MNNYKDLSVPWKKLTLNKRKPDRDELAFLYQQMLTAIVVESGGLEPSTFRV